MDLKTINKAQAPRLSKAPELAIENATRAVQLVTEQKTQTCWQAFLALFTCFSSDSTNKLYEALDRGDIDQAQDLVNEGASIHWDTEYYESMSSQKEHDTHDYMDKIREWASKDNYGAICFLLNQLGTDKRGARIVRAIVNMVRNYENSGDSLAKDRLDDAVIYPKIILALTKAKDGLLFKTDLGNRTSVLRKLDNTDPLAIKVTAAVDNVITESEANLHSKQTTQLLYASDAGKPIYGSS